MKSLTPLILASIIYNINALAIQCSGICDQQKSFCDILCVQLGSKSKTNICDEEKLKSQCACENDVDHPLERYRCNLILNKCIQACNGNVVCQSKCQNGNECYYDKKPDDEKKDGNKDSKKDGKNDGKKDEESKDETEKNTSSALKLSSYLASVSLFFY